MSLTRALTVPFLALSLTCCAHSPRAVEPALPPEQIVRPPCDPGPALMAPPQALPALGDLSMREAFARWIDDMKAYQDMRLQLAGLQEFVGSQCR